MSKKIKTLGGGIAICITIFVFVTGISDLSNIFPEKKTAPLQKGKKGENTKKYHFEKVLKRDESIFDPKSNILIKNLGVPSSLSANLMIALPNQKTKEANVDVGYKWNFKRGNISYCMLLAEVNFTEDKLKIIIYQQ